MRIAGLTLYAQNGNSERFGYKSLDGRMVMRRETERSGWTLLEDGRVLDRDRYRSDLAERFDLELDELRC